MTAVFHEGELAVQAEAGVQAMAKRIGNGLHSTIPPLAQEFLQSQPMAVVGSVSQEGRVWASLLVGEPGFMEAVSDNIVRIKTPLVPGDPLNANLMATSEIGMIIIEPATRRRMRVNGRAEIQPDGSIWVQTDQVYSNCLKYIQAREVVAGTVEAGEGSTVSEASALAPAQQSWIEQADTFFISSFHPAGGADASHRGGYPGFVRVVGEKKLLFPDYSGNMMFQTLGNLWANPNSGLLFIDFERGGTLQLSGKARVLSLAESPLQFVGAERVVEFEIEGVVEIAHHNALRWNFLDYSRFNPQG